ncbi:MAG: hypothetical protein FJW35_19045 [Acidobacteria bacterium]|nr:hypothetical protein [Acidobacteriota bacterium]
MTLPDYQFLSAPLWLITALHILTLSLHFAAMNFMVGGIIAVLWGRFRNRPENPLAQLFIRSFPSIMAMTVTLGVAPLLFLQVVYPRQVYSASIVMAWFWLLVIPAVIVSYYFLYGASFAPGSVTGRKRAYLLIALLGLVYVSLVYSSVFSMAERPDLVQRLYAGNQSGLLWNPDVKDYLFRWLHMVLGAVAVGGFFVGLAGRSDEAACKVGRSFFLWGMIAAAAAGFGWLFSLGEHLGPLMRTPGIWALNVGIVLSVVSLHFFFKKSFIASGAALFVSLVLMVYTRHTVRLLRLADVYDPASMPVTPQWSPFLLFAVCFVLALAVLFYMLRLFFRASPN